MNDLWHADLSGLTIGWAHSMQRASWQGGAALALAWVLCRVGARWPPSVRCWLWRLAFLKLFLSLAWTVPIDLPLLPPLRAILSVTASGLRASTLPSRRAGLPGGRLHSPRSRPSQGDPDREANVPATLLLIWIAGAGACGCLLRKPGKTSQLLCSTVPVVDRRITDACERLARYLGLLSTPRLLRVSGREGLVLIGMLRPAILLPSHLLTDYSIAQIELMLAHELAHLKRRDLWWNWLPALAQVMFWFHPLVWLAGREWRLQQEIACDAIAVQTTGAAPADYGEMLLALAAGHPQGASRWLATAGMLDGYESLKRRLMAMKSVEAMSQQRLFFVSVTLGLLAAGGLIPWRVVAQNGSPSPREAPASSPLGGSRQETAEANPDSESVRRLQQLGRALLLYAQDYDWTLPPMGSPKAARERLYPYVRRDDSVLVDPHSNAPYLLNARLSGHRLAMAKSITYEKAPSGLNWVRIVRNGSIYMEPRGWMPQQRWAAPGTFTSTNLFRPAWAAHRWMIEHRTERIREPGIVAAYEPDPSPDGTRGVLYLDERVKRVSEAEWRRLKAASDIP